MCIVFWLGFVSFIGGNNLTFLLLLVGSDIVGSGQPAEIINPVIRFIKVYVVYCVFLYRIIIRDKGKGYELMD